MAKKDFTTVDPVEQFLTPPPTKPLELTDRPATPAEFETDSNSDREAMPQAERARASEEIRSRRVQLILKKSQYVAMRNAAKRQRKSFNHFCEIIFAEYLERHAEGGKGEK